MTAERMTIAFRAKREHFQRIDAPDCDGYRIPRLTASHVTVADGDRGTLATLMLGTLSRDPDLFRRQLERFAGIPAGGVVYEDDPAWTICPRGDGFMADITTTRTLTR